MSTETEQLDMAVLAAPPNLAALDIPHPAPCVLSLVVGTGAVSNVVDHVTNIDYVRWLDRAAELHSDTIGFPRDRLVELGALWFVARHEIDYLAETQAGDELVIATWVRDMRRIKSWRDYVVYRPADETVVCRAATLFVYVNLATRRPTRIPAAMARQFEPMEEPVGLDADGAP